MTDAMREDDLLRFNMAVVDGIYREWERDQAAKGLAMELLPILVSIGGRR